MRHRGGPAAGQARAERCYWLERAPLGVVVDVEFESLDDGRRDPTRAALVAWKDGAVENEHVRAVPPKSPAAGRAGRSAADDQDLAMFEAHGVSVPIRA